MVAEIYQNDTDDDEWYSVFTTLVQCMLERADWSLFLKNRIYIVICKSLDTPRQITFWCFLNWKAANTVSLEYGIWKKTQYFL